MHIFLPSNVPRQLCTRSTPRLIANTNASSQDRKKPNALFLRTSRRLKRKKTSKTHVYRSQGPLEREKKPTHTAICSCLQIVLSCVSNKMSLSARWDPNFLSSLAADEQKGSPWWFNNLALTLIKATLKKKKKFKLSGEEGNAVGSNWCTISMQTRSRYLGTCCIQSPQPGRAGERNEKGREHFNLPYWKPRASFSCLEPDSDMLFSFTLFNLVGSKNMLLKDTTQDH